MQPIQKINIRLHNNHACKDLYKFFGRFDMKVSKIQENKKFPQPILNLTKNAIATLLNFKSAND